MKIDIGSNLSEFAELMRRRSEATPEVVKKAVIQSTTEIFTISREAMSRLIYNQPIPNRLATKRTIRSGKNKGKVRRFKTPKLVPAWRRTSNLLRKERFYFRGSGVGIAGTIDNSAPYAKARHDLNRPGADGVTRVARWRDEATAKGTPRARAIFREAIKTLGNMKP